jgi:hypothetical protein
MAEQQVELIRDLARAYGQMNLPAISDMLHPDYVHDTRPQSINIPQQDKTRYLASFGRTLDNWASVGTASHPFGRQPPFFHPR